MHGTAAQEVYGLNCLSSPGKYFFSDSPGRCEYSALIMPWWFLLTFWPFQHSPFIMWLMLC